MLYNATNQPKSTLKRGYMWPRGLSGLPAVTLTKKQPDSFIVNLTLCLVSLANFTLGLGLIW